MPGALGPLPPGQRAPVQGGRLAGLAHGQVGGGQLVLGAQGGQVLLAVHPLGVRGQLLQHPHRVLELARGDQGVAQVTPGGQHVTVVPAQRAGPPVQHPLDPPDRVRGPPGRQVGRGEPLHRGQGVGVVGAEKALADRGQVAPVVGGRPGQPATVQALPGPHQHRVATARPQQIARGLPQAGGAGAQALGQPGGRFVLRPGFQQRVGRGPRRLLKHPRGHGGAQRALQHRAHPEHRWRGGPVDGQQAGALERLQSPARALAVRPRSAGVPGQVVAGGGRGQHFGRHGVPVQQRDQGQQGLGRHVR
ncbi:MAG TPA: hypothetical protein VGJ19_11415 [Streptosporangiaceae bacterium]